MAAYDDLVSQVQAVLAKVQADKDTKTQVETELAAVKAERADLEAKLAALTEQLKPFLS